MADGKSLWSFKEDNSQLLSYEDLCMKIRKYNAEELEFISRVYDFAAECHKNQRRQSGEPYIFHPIAVAGILTESHADRDTLSAALLHDVIEDCNVSEEEIAARFNQTIAGLVNGVTNLTQMNFKTRSERNYAIKRKIVMEATKDIREILIKLADRTHNMRTLQYKTEEKRYEKASETMQFYVPWARYIGAEKVRRELEDKSFYYLDKKAYLETELKINEYIARVSADLNAIINRIVGAMRAKKVRFALQTRIKNVYSVYKRLERGESIQELHDLFAIKILLDNVKDCYYGTLDTICSLYPIYAHTYRDYIESPKSNMYSSIHATFSNNADLLFQLQIRTKEMERINTYGVAGLWDTYKGTAWSEMLTKMKKDFPFFGLIEVIDQLCDRDREFCEHFLLEVLGNMISIHAWDGKIVRLPETATALDFAYQMYPKSDGRITAYVNGQNVPLVTTLNDGDNVRILKSENSAGPEEEWLNAAVTIQAQDAIRKSLKIKRS